MRTHLLWITTTLAGALACERAQPAPSETRVAELQTGAAALREGAPTAPLDEEGAATAYLALFTAQGVKVIAHDVSDEERLTLTAPGTPSVLQLGDKRVPKRLRAMKSVELLLPDGGRVSGQVRGFRVSQGASLTQVELLLMEIPGEEHEAYGVTGRDGRLGAQPGTQIATPRQAPLTPAQLEGVREAVVEKMFPDDRSLMPATLRPQNLRVFEAKLAGQHRFVGALEVPVPGRGPGAKISGLLLLDGQVGVTGFVEPPNPGEVSYEPRFFFRLDRAAPWQLFYESMGLRARGQHALSFDADGAPQVSVLGEQAT